MTCTANKKDGGRCRRPAMTGHEVCHAHSGAKVGRPPALTPEVHDRIVQLAKIGCPGEFAAQEAGISATTYYEIKRRGREAEEGPERALVEAIGRGRYEAYAFAMANWRRGMAQPGNWRANVAWIDRFHRGLFDDRGPGGEGADGGRIEEASSNERRLDPSRLSEDQLAYLEGLYEDPDGEAGEKE